ncbi:MAG TPA: sugar ABC transporter ATP-binding protein [Tepidisphaeraceae bacterium]|jgi:ribose transport system ATP-binding protein|nr:sugar ABC transporter ATP-binding protein [Tepidisphaeraceae bacterium]
MISSPILQLKGICKRFPGVIALSDVSLEVGRGEVVAVIGENGAGKSTLMNILGGIHPPDEGQIFIDAKPVSIRNVSDAVAMGIGFVHQELNNLENLEVAGNIFLGREPLWCGPLKLMDRKAMISASRPHLERLGLNVDPRTLLKTLSLAQQQLVEIARALSQNARILVLDEPTSSLTAAETARLLATVKELRNQGVSVIYISHRLGEISQVADRVVALRDGRNAGELPRDQITHENMVRLMIGRDLRSFYVPGSGARQAERLQVKNARTVVWPARSVSFDAAGGEILGFAGLVGAGRSELAESVFGVRPLIEGQVLLDGIPLKIRHCRDAIAAGIFLVPEDRRRTGLVTSMTVRENITLPGLWNYTRAMLISRRAESAEARRQIDSMRIRTPGPEARVMNLSGGNQQKVVLAKWLALEPKVLIVDEPTRGIDVGAKAEIYRLLRALADKGVAVIVISSDMEEVLGISDRIAVMHEGAIAGILDRAHFSEEKVMNLAFGKTAAA